MAAFERAIMARGSLLYPSLLWIFNCAWGSDHESVEKAPQVAACAAPALGARARPSMRAK